MFDGLLVCPGRLVLNMKQLLLLLLVLCGTPLFATHIIGGNFEVTHIAGENFSVTLQLFRDCNPNSSDFNTIIPVAIYDQVDHTLLATYDFQLAATNEVQLGDECYTPQYSCVEEGIYQRNLVLGSNPNGIYLTWARCCRNTSITNIISPLNTGMTFAIDFPDPALQNSSPNWGGYPANGYFCVNTPNTIDLNVTDPDGDQLLYSLVDPYDNSGGINPNPPLPKPFPTINWTPPYNLTDIVGGTPPMSIDAQTGIITVHPNQQGLFAFAVQVEEFRGGTLIGVSRREMQYQVANCPSDLPPDPPIVADSTVWKVFPNQSICIPIEGSDQNAGDVIHLTATSELLNNDENPAFFVDTSGITTITSSFCWTPTCNDIRAEAYPVTFNAFSIGCSGVPSDTSTLEVQIIVVPFVAGTFEKTPNVFTPNGDGINDFFHPLQTYDVCFDELHFELFDRWGSTVYTSDDIPFAWDGHNIKGNVVSDGTYYYTITATLGGNAYSKSGTVTITR